MPEGFDIPIHVTGNAESAFIGITEASDDLIKSTDKSTAALKVQTAGVGALERNAKGARRSIGAITPKVTQLNAKLQMLQHRRDRAFSTKNIKRYNREIKKTERQISKLTGRSNKLSTAMKGAFAYFSVRTAVNGINRLYQSSSRIEAVNKKYKTVFGESSAVIDQFAKDNAAALGLTNNEYKKSAAAVGDLLVPMGFTKQQAAGMSSDLVGLSGALAEWSAGTYEASQVSDILAKAMLGEREQLKSLGISISEADVKQRLLEKGQNRLQGAALAQARALATQELIFEKSKDAQKAFADGANSLQRKGTALRASLKNNFEMLANYLIPAFNWGIQALSSFTGWLVNNGKTVAWLVGLLGAGALAIFAINKATLIWQATSKAIGVATKVWTAVQWALNTAFMASPIGWIVTGIAALAGAIIWVVKNLDTLKAQWDQVWNFAKAVFAVFAADFKLQWLRIKNLFLNNMDIMGKGWHKFALKVGLGDEEKHRAALANISDKTEERKREVQAALDVKNEAIEFALDNIPENEFKKARKARKAAKDSEKDEVFGGFDPNSPAPAMAGAYGMGGGSSSQGEGLNGVGASGGSVKHINVSFENLIENFNAQAGDFKGGLDEMKRLSIKSFVEVMNAINQIR